VTVYDDTGIDQFAGNDQISVWPNPAKDKINISFGNAISTGVRIKVLNILGEELREICYDRAPADKITLDISMYNSGLYYLRIETTDRILVRKITLVK
jgi:hypothetical protein